MALLFHPEPGTVLMCDFDKLGLKEPEMVKMRPAVVISPRLKRRDDLLTLVPLGTTAPTTVMPYQIRIEIVPRLPRPWDAQFVWVKADMIYTVRFDRLELIRTGRDHTGKRQYITQNLSKDQIYEIHKCLLNGLGLSAVGLSALTNYL